jgi:hypothetical protein
MRLRTIVQSAVGLAVPAAVEPVVAVGLPAAGRDWRDPAESGEGGLVAQPLGVVADGDEQCGGGVRADAMASVSKRKDGRPGYQVRYRDPAGVQRARQFGRKAAADQFAASVETDKARGSSSTRRPAE